MQEKLNIIVLSKRWEHHTKSGGYDRLEKEIGSHIIKPAQKENYIIPSNFRSRVWQKIVPSSRYINRYNLADFLAEVNVMYSARKLKPDLVHSLYGEDQLNMILKYRDNLNSALVATFHLPVESEFIQRVVTAGKYNRLHLLDAGIVMSNSMISDYEKWIGKGKVFFIPHGIDTNIFCPSEKSHQLPENDLNVLIVGGHSRDWDMVKKVIKASEERKLRINFSAVVPGYIRKKFSCFSNVKLFTGIPETNLISLYRQAQIVFLPVKYATANNSLLEAISCGTPVISTNTGGTPDYLDDKSGWLMPPGDVHSIVQLLEQFLVQPDLIRLKSEGARNKALEFDWEKISKQVDRIHKFAFERWKRKISSVT